MQTLPASARNCSEQCWAAPKPHGSALAISCWPCEPPLMDCAGGRTAHWALGQMGAPARSI
eukprot:7732685-Alexandrium_andersonii.AAC.1